MWGYDSKKIAFIICVNDEIYYEECLFYIERLNLPEGYLIEVFPIRGAESIYQGYNHAMDASDAKYKVYMHQDVFLVNPDIIKEFLLLFEKHPQAGMAGVLGCRSLPVHRRFYRHWDVGNVLACSEKKAFQNELDIGETKVTAVDGMFIMTSQDIPWREDALTGWDFYDFSQSLEFQRKGWEIWVPRQEEPWCIHDCGVLNLADYDEKQKIFLNQYPEITLENPEESLVYPQYYSKRLNLMMELKEQWKKLLFLEEQDKVREMLEQLWDERFIDTELVIMNTILEIQKEEESFLDSCSSFYQVYKKYMQIKFRMRRERYAPDSLEEQCKVPNVAQKQIKMRVML